MLRMAIDGDVVQEPIVERAVVLELQRADGMRDVFDRVGYAVGKIRFPLGIIASMGPPSEDGGYTPTTPRESWPNPLQWGRRLRTADIC